MFFNCCVGRCFRGRRLGKPAPSQGRPYCCRTALLFTGEMAYNKTFAYSLAFLALLGYLSVVTAISPGRSFLCNSYRNTDNKMPLGTYYQLGLASFPLVCVLCCGFLLFLLIYCTLLNMPRFKRELDLFPKRKSSLTIGRKLVRGLTLPACNF